jgi:ribonuclease P protein component
VVVHVGRNPDGDDAPARVGFTVNRAVGSAVVRNRVKRRLRHLVRERLARLEPGKVYVFRATPASATATYAELGQTLDACLTNVGKPRRSAGSSDGPR